LPNKVLYFSVSTANPDYTTDITNFFAGTLSGYEFPGANNFKDISTAWNPAGGTKFSTLNSGLLIVRFA
jgi:hypothetical protein